MIKKTKKRLFIGGGILLVVILVLAFRSRGQGPITFTSVVVESESFIQSVEETGIIDTDVSIAYGWGTSGRVVSISKTVGDMVSTTDIIAELDHRIEDNARRQASAQLSASVARLNEVLVGVTEENKQTYQARIGQAEASLAQSQSDLEQKTVSIASQIAAAERAVESAQNTLQEVDASSQQVVDAYADLLNTLNATMPNMRDALTEADNILGVNNTFANDDFEDVLGAGNTSIKNTAMNQFTAAERAIYDTEDALLLLSYSSDESAFDFNVNEVQSTLLEVNALLKLVLDTLDVTSPIGNLSQSELDTLKSGVILEKSSINADQALVTNALQAVVTAKNTTVTNQISYTDAVASLASLRTTGAAQIASAERLVDIRRASVVEAQAAYNSLVAPPRAVDIAALRADVSRQQAAVEASQIAIDDKTLTAIVPGVITNLTVDAGENVSPNQEVVTIQSDTFKIDVDISESDITKIALNDIAFVELDAYQGVTFLAYVTHIDPAATEISGVIYYSVELVLDLQDDLISSVTLPDDVSLTGDELSFSVLGLEYGIRPGMSADIEIITFAKQDSIVIPRRALISNDGKPQVRVVTNAEAGTFELRDVVTGMLGNDGKVEVLEGLTIGDEVITFIEESK